MRYLARTCKCYFPRQLKTLSIFTDHEVLQSALLLFLFFPVFLFSVEKVVFPDEPIDAPPPWLTGPLLTPSGQAVPLGHINVEPYLYSLAANGVYNDHWHKEKTPTLWLNFFQCPIQIGLTSWMDVQINPTVFWNYKQHKAHWSFGDFPVGLEIQLYTADPLNWIPNVKLLLREVIPSGKYRNLDPDALGTDAGGAGSWSTQVGLTFSKLYHLYKLHYLSLRLFLQYTLSAPVHVTGFNAYGGGFGADAKVFPGQAFTTACGIEITLAQTWAFALDLLGNWEATTKYSGFPGELISGIPAPLGLPPSIQYSLAPAIEYNWNENLGVIGGAWFSVAGKNAQAFAGAVWALNYYY